jgi:hypothetical protein
MNMKRTTIMMPDDLKIRAVKRADSLGISLAEFIRDSLERNLKSDKAVIFADPYLGDDGVYNGDIPSDLAQNHDTYLYGD